MRKRWLLYNPIQFIIGFMVVFAVSGCSDENLINNEETVMEDSLVHFIVSQKGILSRAGDVNRLTDYYLTAYSGGSSLAKNSHYFLNNGVWDADYPIMWPDRTSYVSFWGLTKDSRASESGVSKLRIDTKYQRFTYVVDTEKPEDISIASYLDINYEMMAGQVALLFTRALAYPTFKCVQGIQNVTINIKEIIVHNIITNGTFNFSTEYNSDGKWTTSRSTGTFGSYKQTFEEPITLNPDCQSEVAISSPWIFIPQKPRAWKPASDGSTANADTKHYGYMEIKCKMITNDTRLCIWGQPSGENEYESLYVPFDLNFNNLGTTDDYILRFTGGYNADGTAFAPHDGVPLTYATWVQTIPDANPWIEKDPEDIIF
jgi:hypothetical protein